MKKEIKKFDEFKKEFIENYVEDGILDCIPLENWEEMEGEVFSDIKNYIISLITEMSDEMQKLDLCGCTRVCFGHNKTLKEIKSIADKYLKCID